jgi:hypothetical protein
MGCRKGQPVSDSPLNGRPMFVFEKSRNATVWFLKDGPGHGESASTHIKPVLEVYCRQRIRRASAINCFLHLLTSARDFGGK